MCILLHWSNRVGCDRAIGGKRRHAPGASEDMSSLLRGERSVNEFAARHLRIVLAPNDRRIAQNARQLAENAPKRSIVATETVTMS
jgi:hypothetical protein